MFFDLASALRSFPRLLRSPMKRDYQTRTIHKQAMCVTAITNRGEGGMTPADRTLAESGARYGQHMDIPFTETPIILGDSYIYSKLN